ncbi:MAG TPA: hypothetical protein VHH33_01925 [Nitrososphaeraceae archaeon]|nr:hypothetical protein [Nitrososphaeraceae archaeon]
MIPVVNLIDKRTMITISFGILVTIVVFLSIQDSLNRPSISRLPISPDVAISSVLSTFNISENQIDRSPQYVYVMSDGTVYESNPELNSVGKIIGSTEPTNTGGSHFAWEINDFQSKKKYYIDAVIAELISNSSYK